MLLQHLCSQQALHYREVPLSSPAPLPVVHCCLGLSAWPNIQENLLGQLCLPVLREDNSRLAAFPPYWDDHYLILTVQNPELRQVGSWSLPSSTRPLTPSHSGSERVSQHKRVSLGSPALASVLDRTCVPLPLGGEGSMFLSSLSR